VNAKGIKNIGASVRQKLLNCYSRESMIAEKFEVMVKLGILNSRMKDFYDIWMLSRQYDFEGASLAEAIRQTFAQRGTTLVQMKEIFSGEFIEEKQVQWNAFRTRIGLEYLPVSFADVVQQVQVFLSPTVEALRAKRYFQDNWIAPDSWRRSHEKSEVGA
jgi:hypothetical protein